MVAALAGAIAVGVWVTARPAGATSAFTPAVLGDEPPGSVVQAREDRDLAVALAVRPTARRLLLVATVLGQDGNGAAGLDVSFRLHTIAAETRLRARSGSPGCYEAETTSSGRPTAVDITVRGRGAGAAALRFTLPATWPPHPADAIVRTADRAYKQLHTLVTRERLGSGPWQSSTQQAFPTIAPFWVGRIENAMLLGTATVGSRPASIVSFAAPQMPAFSTAWIDTTTGRTLELRMTAAAHFMHHVYGPFDAPQQIRNL